MARRDLGTRSVRSVLLAGGLRLVLLAAAAAVLYAAVASQVRVGEATASQQSSGTSSTLLATAPSGRAAVNTAPPLSPVKLIFIHHSTGQAWLEDGHGGLGIALRENNYFVSDTNYGWGPDVIGDRTDIGHWWTWFRGPSSSTYLAALYGESERHSTYSRLATDPGGPNEIVMFKSCFPNSVLGQPNSPATAIADDPMKNHGADGTYTVANAKGIYNDLLPYFGVHPEKLFVAVVAPPVADQDTPGGRTLANWLVDNWLQDAGYTTGNVLVFDFYTVLSSRTGGGASDVGLATGNHHRVWNGAAQHTTNDGADRLAYPTGDSHPNAAGDQKATAEFVPLLNAAYNAWKGATPPPSASPSVWPSPTPSSTPPAPDILGPKTFAPFSTTVKKGRRATLYCRVADDQSTQAAVTIRIRTRAGALKRTLELGLIDTGPQHSCRFICRLARGVYHFTVSARDLSGNLAQFPLGNNRLTVR